MAEERTNPFLSKTIGKPARKSRQKAESTSEKANKEIKRVKEEPLDSEVPVNTNGVPMIRAEMSAAELIPTGDFANVSVGPARIHFFIDPDRELRDDEDYFTPAQRATITKALNEAAEIVEADVVAVQRNIVLESLQQQT
jgi:hypothetical protein